MKKIPLIDIRSFLAIVTFGLLLVVLAACGSSSADSAEKPEEIRLDYAYYSPTSLVLKKFGWAEEEFKEDGIDVTWALSQGSNKALEFLNSDSVDFGSTAGAAALMSKANGAPIKNVYLYSKPEWTALVTNKDSGITSVQDLKGKKVAATLGTDPYIFLLRTLDAEGVSPDDIEIVNLQHGDGASALTSGSVDAWAGLDPHMARLELESGAELFYRNADFNTYGFLNVREEFAEKYPEYVERVIKVYEKARKWAIENPDELAELVAEEAGISVDVAKIQMERNDFSQPVPGDVQKTAILEAGKVLQAGEVIKADADIEKLTDELIDPSFAEEVVE
ncbi:aliphatic sulfonate ABC transporter substrate-binding protein [Radiobacillus kanasensis]|uniref:aliphatic sulfonate ABC transporter substrate-binding protein n=1 Tax=Radiobacillus kanasensis TaxID=2844358 RepID=UPI001E47C750|nr:aliphatic sulfonate ABC transporter substrate-binding protein [Radiobacillus kanasensis]UFT98478.1 aliphatic sulfonate ABC transporter substrate-binding protein [Radiobacillus kanasensis]